ncbi:MAG TPA: CopG family transcriptional regulator [Rudaea sp.]
MKSQRLTLMISPEDKRRFKTLAEDRGMSTSEFVRQAVHAYGVSSIDDTRELAALTAEIRAAMPAMRKSLRQANTSVERALASIAARRKKH